MKSPVVLFSCIAPKDSGSILVEATIAIPLLLLLLAGLFSIGLQLHEQALMLQAARSTARNLSSLQGVNLCDEAPLAFQSVAADLQLDPAHYSVVGPESSQLVTSSGRTLETLRISVTRSAAANSFSLMGLNFLPAAYAVFVLEDQVKFGCVPPVAG